MSVFNFLHRDARDKFYRKPFTTSTLPSRAAPATPGPLETIPVRDLPSCGDQRELAESQYPLHVAGAPATIRPSPFPETHYVFVTPLCLSPSAWNTCLPFPSVVVGDACCCNKLQHCRDLLSHTIQYGCIRSAEAHGDSGTQLLSSVALPFLGPQRLCFWLAEGKGMVKKAQPFLYCFALNCSRSISRS